MQKQTEPMQMLLEGNRRLHMLREMQSAIAFAQKFAVKPVYTINDVRAVDNSITTAYRRLHELEKLGLAKFKHGSFSVKTEVVLQPPHVFEKLIPSLVALKESRRFGKFYTESDVNFAKKHLPEKFLTTLDYAAWELTKFQTPRDFFIYVNDIEKASTYLKNNGFSEGKRGRVILLPKKGSFDNEIERIYLDCISHGERSILDAIALELLFGDHLTVKGRFPIEYADKVREDMPRVMRNEYLRT